MSVIRWQRQTGAASAAVAVSSGGQQHQVGQVAVLATIVVGGSQRRGGSQQHQLQEGSQHNVIHLSKIVLATSRHHIEREERFGESELYCYILVVGKELWRRESNS